MKPIFLLLLAALLIAVSVAPALASNTVNHIDYVALGDSIAAGVLLGDSHYPSGGSGLGYTDNIAKNLNDAGVLDSFNKDFAISGMTAERLAAATAVLNIPDTPQWHLVKDAEIVTLDIGANDLMKPLYEYEAPLVANPNSIWYTNPSLVAYQISTEILPEICYNLYNGKGLEIKANIETILQNILNANKKVEIYVMGYYNPLPMLWSDNTPIQYLNSCIFDAISDVMTKNKNVSITYVDTLNVMAGYGCLYPTDIHPTAAGYQTIANEFWNRILPILNKSK